MFEYELHFSDIKKLKRNIGLVLPVKQITDRDTYGSKTIEFTQ